MKGPVFAIAIALSVAGCGVGGESPLTSASGGNSGLPAGESSTVNPCGGVRDCIEIVKVDVDGDGSADRVGMTVTRNPSPAGADDEASVAVRIASAGQVKAIEARVLASLLPDSPFVGAFRISRERGADLVLHTRRGSGNAEQFVVIGWQNDSPAFVVRPPELNANYGNQSIWYMSSSHGVREWVTCADGAFVTVNKLSAPEAEGVPLPGGGLREEDHFAFDGSEWKPAGSSIEPDNDFDYKFDPHTQTFLCQDQAASTR